jgi:hypothetical protein
VLDGDDRPEPPADAKGYEVLPQSILSTEVAPGVALHITINVNVYRSEPPA